ncbi:MAG: hypothetical protein SFV81_08935 [Pirellulaceae bacterium]|nr:hypothetical protein [Pirellulaceae bacterium]
MNRCLQNLPKLVSKIAVPSLLALQVCSSAAAQQVSLASSLRLPRESIYVLQKDDTATIKEANQAEAKDNGGVNADKQAVSQQSQNAVPITDPAQSPTQTPMQSPTAGLGLAELEQLACQSNPTILRYSALVGSARGLAYQAGRMANPLVGYDGQQIGSRGLAEQHGAMISQDFIRREKRQLDRSVATQEVAQAEQRLAAQQQRVLTDVRGAYYASSMFSSRSLLWKN